MVSRILIIRHAAQGVGTAKKAVDGVGGCTKRAGGLFANDEQHAKIIVRNNT